MAQYRGEVMLLSSPFDNPKDTKVVRLDGRPFKALCDSGFRPNKLSGIILLWLAQHFSDSTRIKESGLVTRLWDADVEKSKIQILPVEKWEPRTTEQRPALLVKEQDQKFIRYGIDNRLMGGSPPFDTERIHVAGIQGSHTVFCISGESGEAKQLAAEVSQELMKFAPIVREWLDFQRLELVSIGKLSKLEEATENFVVPVDIAYAYLEQWKLSPLDVPLLNEIRSIIGY